MNNTDRPLKLLFIGNSATYVHDLPQKLSRLATKAGYPVIADCCVEGGNQLADFLNPAYPFRERMLGAVAKGHDIVFLQEYSYCIATEEKRAITCEASKKLDSIIRETGAKTYFYIRPPIGEGYDIGHFTSYEQCIELDKLFNKIAHELGATNAHVNRAFAYALKNLSVPLWGPDNAHISPEGAYLAVCVFFSTLFRVSSAVLDTEDLPPDVARSLQQAADQVTLGNYIPQ